MIRAKTKDAYVCSQCGSIHNKWSGQCADCEAWNTLTQERLPEKGVGYAGERAQSVSLQEVSDLEHIRHSTGFEEFDRVLGGGVVEGGITLVGGDPGIGKSTLLLQVLANLAKWGEALYVSGEESLGQVAARAQRLNVKNAPMTLLAETEVSHIEAILTNKKPAFVVIDSIQTLYNKEYPGAPGTVTQVRECSARLARVAKQEKIAIFLVGHVTKTGEVAGPRVLEHIVDAVIFFEGQHDYRYRMLRSLKNRFGAVNELGVFAMTEQGLKEVKNPSGIFLSRGKAAVPGSVVMVAWEGTRPLLLEIQALVDDATGQVARRVTVGTELNRLIMLLAILNRHAAVYTAGQDVFINLVGGLRVQETSTDLSLLVAVISSVKNKPLPQNIVVFGEVGLAGEIRPVPFGQERLKEAAKQGFTKALIPRTNINNSMIPAGMEVVGVETLGEVMERLSEWM